MEGSPSSKNKIQYVLDLIAKLQNSLYYQHGALNYSQHGKDPLGAHAKSEKLTMRSGKELPLRARFARLQKEFSDKFTAQSSCCQGFTTQEDTGVK